MRRAGHHRSNRDVVCFKCWHRLWSRTVGSTWEWAKALRDSAERTIFRGLWPRHALSLDACERRLECVTFWLAALVRGLVPLQRTYFDACLRGGEGYLGNFHVLQESDPQDGRNHGARHCYTVGRANRAEGRVAR